jgi:hypothetical protein
VLRCEGDDHQVVEFEVYGPKVIASIRGMEDVLESRCIHITMLRTTGPKGNLVVSESGENWAQARHGLYCFALQHFAGVRNRYLRGAGAGGLNNRQAELWRPLLAIASYLDDRGAEGLLALIQEYALSKAKDAEKGDSEGSVRCDVRLSGRVRPGHITVGRVPSQGIWLPAEACGGKTPVHDRRPERNRSNGALRSGTCE